MLCACNTSCASLAVLLRDDRTNKAQVCDYITILIAQEISLDACPREWHILLNTDPKYALKWSPSRHAAHYIARTLQPHPANHEWLDLESTLQQAPGAKASQYCFRFMFFDAATVLPTQTAATQMATTAPPTNHANNAFEQMSRRC